MEHEVGCSKAAPILQSQMFTELLSHILCSSILLTTALYLVFIVIKIENTKVDNCVAEYHANILLPPFTLGKFWP